MAFERLVVSRSPVSAWCGAMGLVALFGAWRANRSIDHLLMPFALICAYGIFYGIYGAWWRVPRLDRDARQLRLPSRRVVSLDSIGDVTVEGRELRASGLSEPIYRGYERRELVAMQHVLDGARGRGGRARLHRVRRLAFHRSWGMFALAAVGFAATTFAAVNYIVIGGSHEIEYKLIVLSAYSICVVLGVYALFGSLGRDQLLVDPIAGILVRATGEIVTLDALGALSIVVRQRPPRAGHYTYETYHLLVANVAEPLFVGMERWHTERRRDALEVAVLQHRLRAILEAPAIESEAFRGGLDIRAEVARQAGDSVYRTAALRALTHDPEPTIRERARSLL